MASRGARLGRCPNARNLFVPGRDQLNTRIWVPRRYWPATARQGQNLGEIVEHEAGYRSEFGKIVSLDYGDPELLDKFRKIYRVNQVPDHLHHSLPSPY